jgi:hypothetical protein
MIDEDEIGDDHGACAFDVGEISDGGVDGIEGVAIDIEEKIIK